MTDPRPVAILDPEGNRHIWEPGDEPVLALVAPMLDRVIAPGAEDDAHLGLADAEGRMLSFYPAGVGGTNISGPDVAEEYLDYTDREHALAIIAEFVDGELEALARRPWQLDLPVWQFDEDRFHALASLVDLYVLEAMGELTANTRVAIASREIEFAELFEVAPGTWREVTERAGMLAPDFVEKVRQHWREALHEAHTRGERIDAAAYARAITDRHLRYDVPATPGSDLGLGERVVTSEVNGRRITAGAVASSVNLENLVRTLGAQEPWEPEEPGWYAGMLYRLVPDDELGWVVVGPRLDGSGERWTPDLTVPMAWSMDMIRLAVRAGLRPEPLPFTALVACAPGWETAPRITVQRFEDERGSWVCIDPVDPVEPVEGGQTEVEGVPAWAVLKTRPVAASALGLPVGSRAFIEDDWVRFVQVPDNEGEWRFASRGPVWSMLRTVGWGPQVDTPWSRPLD